MDETLNTANEVREPVVEAQGSSGEGSAVAAESLPGVVGSEDGKQTVAAGSAAAQPDAPKQTREENAAAKRFRLEAEAARREADAARRERDALTAALNANGYAGSAAEIADTLVAGKTGRDVAAVRAEREQREAAEQQMRQSAAELDTLRNFRRDAMLREDIAKIRAAYPDCKAEKPEDLGDEFVGIMATGAVDAITAYEVLEARRKRGEPTPPPPLPSVGASSAADKEFYTPEEVDRLSDAELDNPKIRDRIKKSMERWART